MHSVLNRAAAQHGIQHIQRKLTFGQLRKTALRLLRACDPPAALQSSGYKIFRLANGQIIPILQATHALLRQNSCTITRQ